MKSRSDIQPNAVGAKPIAREPTEAMIVAAIKDSAGYVRRAYADTWRAMWDAAPSPEGVGLRPFDRGPWKVVLNRQGERVIGSDDFEHDVWLRLSGDFATEEDWETYMAELCAKLNAVGQEGPSEPEGGG